MANVIQERTITNTRHAVGNGYRGQTTASIESSKANARHVIVYGIVGK